jgi:hypothetical protein
VSTNLPQGNEIAGVLRITVAALVRNYLIVVSTNLPQGNKIAGVLRIMVAALVRYYLIPRPTININ